MLNPKELRHDLHKHPELSLEEFRTTRVLKQNIEELLSEYNTKCRIQRPLKTGLLIDYRKSSSDKYTLLRADIDALPIREKTGAQFQSRNNNMHACGHDVHAAILYGTLEWVVKNQIDQNILFLFQPAEEESGGAKKIIESNLLASFQIEQAFALHVSNEYPVGTVAFRPNYLFSSSLEINIDFQGKSAHIAKADQGKNALLALAEFLHSCDQLVSNSPDKIVLGFGEAHSGTARNIIPDKALLKGTLRTSTMEKGNHYFDKIEKMLADLKNDCGVDYKLTKGSQYKEVYNSPELFAKAKYSLAKEFSFVNCETKMTAEDFGYFSDLYPSLMLWLGTNQGQKRGGLHTPYYLPGDEVIDKGIEVFQSLLHMD